jgi:hypothetical protein
VIILRTVKLYGHLECTRKKTGHILLVGDYHWKKEFGRHRYRWKGNVKFNFREVVCDDVDWIELA